MDKAAEMKISVGFLDPQVLTTTKIHKESNLVIQALRNAMTNDYVVGAFGTGGHYVTLIICMKFKEVWYLDSAKHHPARKFKDLRALVNWSVPCRFCSQNSIS